MKVLSLNFKSWLSFELDYYKAIAVFRIAVVLIAIIDFSSVLIDLDILTSMLPWKLGLMESEYYSIFTPFYSFLTDLGIEINYFIRIVSIFYLLVLILCGIGYHTKKNFFLAIILQLIIFRTINNFNYGYDNFITMSFFYCLLFPVNYEFSIDKKYTHNQISSSSKYSSLTFFLKTHLSIIYFVSGVAKAVDINWWNGNAIWRALATLDDFIYTPPAILAIISSLTVVMEILYPFLAFSKFKKVRRFLVFDIILMHLGIAIFLGLSSFAGVMIIWNIIAFYKDFSKK